MSVARLLLALILCAAGLSAGCTPAVDDDRQAPPGVTTSPEE